MTSLTAIFQTGLGALRASQQGLAVVSQNIANANTPGYVRTEINFSPLNIAGIGGISAGEISRAADRFLAAAVYMAESARGAASARADLLNRAQASFGDPQAATSMFSAMDRIWSGFTDLSIDPASSLRRGDAVGALQALYVEIGRTAGDIQILVAETDERIADAVAEAQDLITSIHAMNAEIRLSRGNGADPSGVENAQSVLIDQLAALMDIRVSPHAEGGVHIRTLIGGSLVGEMAARLSYTPSGVAFSAPGMISYAAAPDFSGNLEPYISGGRIAGLLQTRDVDLKNIAESLGGFAASVADALNAAHNENSAAPAVKELSGRQTGLLGTDALNFTGGAVVAVTDAAGALAERLTIDFDAGTITTESPAATINFTNSIGAFAAALDTALGAHGDADFTAGRLTLTAAGAGGGLVLQQDGADPSARAGRGFAHFFGLNDLLSRPSPLFFETGGAATDLHGLAAGGVIGFSIRDANGRLAATPSVGITGPLALGTATWADLVTALNDPLNGLGQYATFAYDSATGKIGWTPKAGFQLALANDTTARGATGVSFSSLFGVGPSAAAARAVEISVDAAIAADPARLGVGRPDLSGPLGDIIIEAGDNRGAAALFGVRDGGYDFPAAGVLVAQSTSLANYTARLAGIAGALTADAARADRSAAALAAAAGERRAEVEAVSIDDELIRLTTYQNAYAAASRLIQAASEMYDVLLTLGRRI